MKFSFALSAIMISAFMNANVSGIPAQSNVAAINGNLGTKTQANSASVIGQVAPEDEQVNVASIGSNVAGVAQSNSGNVDGNVGGNQQNVNQIADNQLIGDPIDITPKKPAENQEVAEQSQVAPANAGTGSVGPVFDAEDEINSAVVEGNVANNQQNNAIVQNIEDPSGPIIGSQMNANITVNQTNYNDIQNEIENNYYTTQTHITQITQVIQSHGIYGHGFGGGMLTGGLSKSESSSSFSQLVSLLKQRLSKSKEMLLLAIWT